MKLNIKLSRAVLLLGAVAVALLALNALLIMDYRDIRDQKDELADRVEMVERNLAGLREQVKGKDVEKLKADLAGTQEKLNSMQGTFPPSIQDTNLVALVTGAARETGVSITSLGKTPSGAEVLGTGNYAYLRYKVTVQARPQQVSAFLEKLEQGPFRTVVVHNLSVVPSDEGYLAMTFDLTAYMQASS